MNPPPAGLLQLQNLIVNFIQISVGIAFIILVIVLFYAGIIFLTSGGDSKAIQKASQTITWALLGMLFLVLAWLVFRLIEAFTGVPVTQFCIGFPGATTGC